MSVVDIKDVAKSFDEVQAVDGISLQIVAGEFLVILGPSGCGKTTLMRLIAGLEQPTRGEIWIGDRDMTGLPPRMRQIAMVFQSYALYPHMNVYHNIGFPLKAKRQDLDKQQRDMAIRHAADMVSIGHLLDRRPRHLSGGERQRVAIARALVTEPMVLLLDEPLSNLDAKLRAAARDELKEFQRRLGITTIFVTHDQVEAMGLGDRIVVMSAGRVQQIGTPQTIYDDPDNIFVATFLGSPGMNLLPDDGHVLGFRPENFLPANRTNGQRGGLSLTYQVKRVEFLGSDRLVYGYVDGFPETRLILAKLPISIDDPIDVGSSYKFAVPQPALRYFDKESGQRKAVVPNG